MIPVDQKEMEKAFQSATPLFSGGQGKVKVTTFSIIVINIQHKLIVPEVKKNVLKKDIFIWGR